MRPHFNKVTHLEMIWEANGTIDSIYVEQFTDTDASRIATQQLLCNPPDSVEMKSPFYIRALLEVVSIAISNQREKRVCDLAIRPA